MMLSLRPVSILSLALLAGLAGSAAGAPVGIPGQDSAALPLQPFGGDPVQPAGGGSGDGYSPRVNPLRGVMPNDRVSVTLTMYDSIFNSVTVNSLGDWRCLRGSTLIDGGSNRNGTGRVQFSWDETVSGNRTFIRATIRTSNAEPLLPLSATVPLPGGQSSPAAYWSWRFGATDPINYQTNITQVTLLRSSISLSSDNGQSYSSTMTTTSGIPNATNWNPGSDPGQLMTNFGDGTNFVLLQYEVAYVPPPGSAVLVAAGLATIASRRRR
jgi:hypothetical protein